MGKQGRPKKGEERPTVQVRVYADQVEVISWIARIQRVSTAAVIGDLIDQPLRTLYALYYKHAERIKAAEDEARRLTGQEPTPPLPPIGFTLVPVTRDANGETTPVRVAPPAGDDKPPPKRGKRGKAAE